MADQTPTVGRRVWLFPNGDPRSAGMAIRDWTVPCDAGIAFVSQSDAAQHTDIVTVSVVDHMGGAARGMEGVQLLRDGQSPPAWGIAYAEWMPYQKGQAAKTEEAERALVIGSTPMVPAQELAPPLHPDFGSGRLPLLEPDHPNHRLEPDGSLDPLK